MNGALQWLEDNQDKNIEDLRASEAAAQPESDETNPNIEPAPLKEGEEAKSMVCTDCGKKFRSMLQVQAHAERTYDSPVAPLDDQALSNRVHAGNTRTSSNQPKRSLP